MALTSTPPKLVILRGPSGSGKSTIARELRLLTSSPTALVEQDYLRRQILKEKDTPDGANIQLIEQTVAFCLESGYNVILEGILVTSHYGDMLRRLVKRHPGETHAYYFDIPFDETLRRHSTKSNAHEFGEDEMREWYRLNDRLKIAGEKIITADLSKKAILSQILADTRL